MEIEKFWEHIFNLLVMAFSGPYLSRVTFLSVCPGEYSRYFARIIRHEKKMDEKKMGARGAGKNIGLVAHLFGVYLICNLIFKGLF